MTLPTPSPPTLSLPQVIVITAKDAEYYAEACVSLSDDTYDEDVGYIGLDRESACAWSIHGFTVQGWYNLQQDLILIQNYVEQVKFQRDFYEKQLLNRSSVDGE